mmetsp:Transcript_6260/g.25348  ORF Transcript_6260/g.25348 Transcript_6260/m.25348 type:complete len:202 (-) Transcript_6260:2481-3086(-)
MAPVCFPALLDDDDAPTAASSRAREAFAKRRRRACGPTEEEMSMSEYRGRCTGTHLSFAPRVRSVSTRLATWPEPMLSRASARFRVPAPSRASASLFAAPAPPGFRFAGFFERAPLSEYGLTTTSVSRLEAPRDPGPRPASELCRDTPFPLPEFSLEKVCCRSASCIFISRARRLARRNMSRSEDIVAGFTMTSFIPAATH